MRLCTSSPKDASLVHFKTYTTGGTKELVTPTTNNAAPWDRFGCCYDKVSCQLQLQRAGNQTGKAISQLLSAGSFGAVRHARERWRGHVISGLMPCTNCHTGDIMRERGTHLQYSRQAHQQIGFSSESLGLTSPSILFLQSPVGFRNGFSKKTAGPSSLLRTLCCLEEDGFCFLFLI